MSLYLNSGRWRVIFLISTFRMSLALRRIGRDRIRRYSTFRGAIVGSGPAAFYCAESLYKNLDDQLSLDVYERLPVPYGLIRFGVAPDHPDLKKCIGGFERMVERVGQRFQFFGNVRVGVDVKVEELLRAYHFVVLAYGAESERKLGVDGEDGPNCTPARVFVNWYNGLPGSSTTAVDLQRHDTAVIFGHGNVALDVARVLLTPVDVLSKTDIAEHALESLAKSRVRRCVLVGRRGPLQVSFTTAELRQLIQTPSIAPIIDYSDFLSLESVLPKLERARKRLTQLMYDVAKNPPKKERPNSSWHLKFLRSPTKILRALDSVGGVELAVNRLERVDADFANDRAVDTGDRETLDCGLVIYSIGYKTLNIDSTLPFDPNRHVVQTDGDGRVSGVPSLYACGWCSRGPVGVLVTTQNHAKIVADTIRHDGADGKFLTTDKRGSEVIKEILDQRDVQFVSWDDWTKIDRVEKERGSAKGKPREKIVFHNELLKVAKSAVDV